MASAGEKLSAALRSVKMLSLMLGGFGVFFGLVAMPAGLFVGLHLLLAAVVWFLFGAIYLWSASRVERDPHRTARVMFVVTLFLLALLFAAIVLSPPIGFAEWGWSLIVVCNLLMLAYCSLVVVRTSQSAVSSRTP